MATILTMAVTLAVTAHGRWERSSFRVTVGMAFVLVMAFPLFFILSLVWHRWFHTALCILGVCLYGLYLLCDTQLVVN